MAAVASLSEQVLFWTLQPHNDTIRLSPGPQSSWSSPWLLYYMWPPALLCTGLRKCSLMMAMVP